MSDISKRNKNLVFNLLILMLAMLMLTYASVPLYKIFCQVTGFGGTVKQVIAQSNVIGKRKIKIYFNANLDPNLKWYFKNGEISKEVMTGENMLTFYIAENLTDNISKAMAAYNITPFKAGKYFHKIECFCFEEQILLGKQKVEFPVLFYIDPKIEQDINMNDVKEITLSYTFFDISDK